MLFSMLVIFMHLTNLHVKAAVIDMEKSEKRKLIVFSGSDWCTGCIRFKKEVLSDDLFINFAKDNIEIITADFPQRTKLPEEQIAKNEALAAKYNKKGEFPKLVLLSADESQARVIPYNNQDSRRFVEELKGYLQ